MDIHPVTDPDDLPRKVDAIRDVLAMTHIRGIAERRRAHRRDIDVSDAAMRIAVGFARFLPPNSPLPSDEFLIDLATRVLDGYDGTTLTPRKVQR